MNNLAIRQFKLTIEEFINKNDLPVEIKRLVLSEIKNEIDKAADQQVISEAKEIEHGKDVQQN